MFYHRNSAAGGGGGGGRDPPGRAFMTCSEGEALGRIYLIRHGRTAWNRRKIFRGRADVDLDELGQTQARCVAEALREVKLRRIYTSPLARTRETAAPLAEAKEVAARVDHAFTDIDYGTWTARSEKEVLASFPNLYERWKTQPHTIEFPDGESLQMVRSRAADRLRELAHQDRQMDIAVVTHRVVLKVLLCEARGLDNSHFWNVRVDPAGISIVESDGAQLTSIAENDTKHLEELGQAEQDDF